MKSMMITVGLALLLAGCRTFDKKAFDPFEPAPGETPQFFAPGKICTRYHEHSAPTISPAGDEIYWSAFLAPLQSEAPPVILFVKKINGEWTEPAVASFSGQYRDNGPVFTPDGTQIFFYSNRPATPGQAPDQWDIWVVDRDGDGWGEPWKQGDPINASGFQGQVSFTRQGTMYYLGFAEGYVNEMAVYRAKKVNGQFQEPERLPEVINFQSAFKWCPYIAPDESYLLFSGYQEGGYGAGDIYVCFRDEEDRWSSPVNLGPAVNSEDNDRFPAVSSDGRWLFFASKRTPIKSFFDRPQTYDELMDRYNHPGNGLTDIYWLESKCIDSLRPQGFRKEGQ